MTSACYDCPKLLGWQHTHVVYCQLGHDNAHQGVLAMTVACQSCNVLLFGQNVMAVQGCLCIGCAKIGLTLTQLRLS